LFPREKKEESIRLGKLGADVDARSTHMGDERNTNTILSALGLSPKVSSPFGESREVLVKALRITVKGDGV
jgi:hypothetical protein